MVVGEFSAGLLGGHPKVFVLPANRLNEKAAVGVARMNRRSGVPPLLPGRARVESQSPALLFCGVMAALATLDEDRADLLFEEFRVTIGLGERRE